MVVLGFAYFQMGESRMNTLKRVTKPGMIKEGDTLLIDTCYGKFKAKAKMVFFPKTTREEVVIHKKKNHYFILSMVCDGSSWVNEAYIANGHDFRGIKNYQKGNVKNL